MVEINVDVEGVDETIDALKSGLQHGLDDAGQWMLDEAEDEAIDHITRTGTVFKGTVNESFEGTRSDLHTNGGNWRGTLVNHADHAELVNRGARPLETNPSVQDIINWVDIKVNPADLPQEELNKLNIEQEWDPELVALARSYGPSTVIVSFAIRRKIHYEGYDGIFFTQKAAEHVKKVGPVNSKKKVEAKMREFVKRAEAGGGSIPKPLSYIGGDTGRTGLSTFGN